MRAIASTYLHVDQAAYIRLGQLVHLEFKISPRDGGTLGWCNLRQALERGGGRLKEDQ